MNDCYVMTNIRNRLSNKFLKTIVPNNVWKISRKYLRRSSYLVNLQGYNLRFHKRVLVFFKNFANIIKYLIVFLKFRTSCFQGTPLYGSCQRFNFHINFVLFSNLACLGKPLRFDGYIFFLNFFFVLTFRFFLSVSKYRCPINKMVQ